MVAVVDLEDEEDDVKHEEAPPAAAGDAQGDAHGTPELIAPATIEAQLAAEVCVKLSSEPFLRKLVSPIPHHSPLTPQPPITSSTHQPLSSTPTLNQECRLAYPYPKP